ncbi:HAD family hydrolase [Sulfurimonas sp. MAG313]|nr:HAD family hydrolase [Sulfurimonas sp. MAG313]MDF1880650.1 HAD family hydrolase [Sulfurimonas sp. MAG313]
MKIAIFDMDGTLLDSAKDITMSVNTVRKLNHGLDELTSDYVIEAINRENRNLAELFYGTKKYEKKDEGAFEAHYHEQCIQNVYLYEGIKETIHALRSQKVRISVATNAPTKFARRMLEECGIFEYFDFVIGADRVAKAKPDREMLVYILKNYGYKRGHKALMIGDNIKDMQAAHNAGIDSAFATWGFSPQSRHHQVFSSPQDVLKYFS